MRNHSSGAISRLNGAYGGIVGLEIGSDCDYLSSSEHSSDCARRASTWNGIVYANAKSGADFVRAFARL